MIPSSRHPCHMVVFPQLLARPTPLDAEGIRAGFTVLLALGEVGTKARAARLGGGGGE